jgi:hypothetical protein
MPDLPKKKVGIVACSGEEMAEGTVTRLAALKVLEQLRPAETVTICLPLFLAGGEGDRAFARFYPTIAVDGCDKRCAARGTEMYSGKPAAGVVVGDVARLMGFSQLGSGRRLNAAGARTVDAVAAEVAHQVDVLLDLEWDRRRGRAAESEPELALALDEAQGSAAKPEDKIATCSCGSGIPVQTVRVEGQEVTFIALPLIFALFRDEGKQPGDDMVAELMHMVKIYNPVPDEQETAYSAAVMHEYAAFCREQK